MDFNLVFINTSESPLIVSIHRQTPGTLYLYEPLDALYVSGASDEAEGLSLERRISKQEQRERRSGALVFMSYPPTHEIAPGDSLTLPLEATLRGDGAKVFERGGTITLVYEGDVIMTDIRQADAQRYRFVGVDGHPEPGRSLRVDYGGQLTTTPLVINQ